MGRHAKTIKISLFDCLQNNNFTYNVDQGGFSDENFMCIDQRGFKILIQEEANEFLLPSQIRLNSTVETVSYSSTGVKVILKDGSSISGDYALSTFSVGVLQNDDVEFIPPFPGMLSSSQIFSTNFQPMVDYKKEAIESITMGTYTKIFLQFPNKFWFDTEVRCHLRTYRITAN